MSAVRCSPYYYGFGEKARVTPLKMHGQKNYVDLVHQCTSHRFTCWWQTVITLFLYGGEWPVLSVDSARTSSIHTKRLHWAQWLPPHTNRVAMRTKRKVCLCLPVSLASANRFPWLIARECVWSVSAFGWMQFSIHLTVWLWLWCVVRDASIRSRRRRDFCFRLASRRDSRDLRQSSPVPAQNGKRNQLHK